MTDKEKCEIALTLERHMTKKYPKHENFWFPAVVAIIAELDKLGYRIMPVDFDDPLPKKRFET